MKTALVSLTRLALSVGAASLFAGCAEPQSQPHVMALSPGFLATSGARPPKRKCATSPPQHEWIFEGACQKIFLSADGGSFDLHEYQNITILGTIGATDANKRTRFYVVDALDNGDIKEYNSQPFPPYVESSGTTVLYVAAINQSRFAVEPVARYGIPILQYTVSDYAGLPGNVCGMATLATVGSGRQWTAFPGTAQVNGDSVTIDVFQAPLGFEFPSREPVYFAISCWTA